MRGLQELLWVKRKFVHRFRFLRTRSRWLFELLRYRWLIEVVHGNLQTTRVTYTPSHNNLG